MKSLCVALIAALAGGAVAWWRTDREFKSLMQYLAPPQDIYRYSGNLNIPVGPSLTTNGDSDRSPEIEFVNGQDHDFGSMERFGRRQHVYIMKNVGDATLTIALGGTTCKCTVFKSDKSNVPPGEEARITIEWVAETREGQEDFRQEATIKTNVPGQNHVKLGIIGKVTTKLKAEPEKLVFTDVAVSSGATATAKLFAFRHERLIVTEIGFEDPDTSSLFNVNVTRLSEKEIKEAKADDGAQVTVTLKPGLPLGNLKQTVLLTTNLSDKPVFQLQLGGNVVGDIGLGGPVDVFNSQTNLLHFGAIQSSVGRSVKLRILVKGKHRDATDVHVASVTPAESLSAQLSEGRLTRADGPKLYLLTVAVPKGAPATNRLGGLQSKPGKIVLETTHPDAKRIELTVKFAVQ